MLKLSFRPHFQTSAEIAAGHSLGGKGLTTIRGGEGKSKPRASHTQLGTSKRLTSDCGR